MNKITPFLWFNGNAENAAEFYLSAFPETKRRGSYVRKADTFMASAAIGELARVVGNTVPSTSNCSR